MAGDEMGDRLHLIIDGVDGRTHYVETADATKLDEIKRGHIVSLDPVPTKAEPKPADLNIHTVAEANGGIYRPSQHLEATRDIIERRHGDPDAFIRSHVRRLEALRRAGHVRTSAIPSRPSRCAVALAAPALTGCHWPNGGSPSK